jgi:hypothetical protein
MPHLNRVRGRVVNMVTRPQAISGIMVTSMIVTNNTVVTVCGIVIGLALAIFLSAVSILLFRAVLKVDDQSFERTVYLLKLVSLYAPRVLLAGRSKQVTEACVTAVLDDPPPRPAVPHCPECLLHGEGLKH